MSLDPYAVIVPFRLQADMDRASQLRRFLQIPFPGNVRVVVVHQGPQHKFNRGSLLNAGAAWIMRAEPQLTHMWFHDVDLVPSPAVLAMYDRPPCSDMDACHLGACWTRYVGHSYLGGVTGFTPRGFLRCNGFPNDYWGWGGEDDELRRRVQACGMRVTRPATGAACTYTDMEGMGLAEKLAWLRRHPEQKNTLKWELAVRHASTWEDNGVRQTTADDVVARDGGHVVHLSHDP